MSMQYVYNLTLSGTNWEEGVDTASFGVVKPVSSASMLVTMYHHNL